MTQKTLSSFIDTKLKTEEQLKVKGGELMIIVADEFVV